MELVERFKYSLQLILRPGVGLLVPVFPRINLHHETGDEGKVVTSPFQGIEKIRVAFLVDTDLCAIGQDNVLMHNVILDQAVEALITPMATT